MRTTLTAIVTLVLTSWGTGHAGTTPAWMAEDFIMEEVVVTAGAPASFYMEEIVVTAEAPAHLYTEEVVVTATQADFEAAAATAPTNATPLAGAPLMEEIVVTGRKDELRHRVAARLRELRKRRLF